MEEERKYKKAGELFIKLLTIMESLRGERGCPWDREQDFHSLKRYTLEEAYEVVDAINREDFEALQEELGDLLLQVVFISKIGEEKKIFDIENVLEKLCHKLVIRHPHVFGSEKLETSDEVLKRWEEMKEKNRIIPDFSFLPSTTYAMKISKFAHRFRFDWKNEGEVIKKIEEEIEELKKSLLKKNDKEIEDELGDVLFTAINLARHLNVDPESALLKRAKIFEKRLKRALEMISGSGRKAEELSEEELDYFWQKAKEEIS